MTFLDSSAIIDYLSGHADVVEYLEGREPFRTSSICVYEVLDGKVGSGTTDVHAVRQDFAGVQSVDFTDSIAVEAGRLQDELMDDGVRLSHRDAMVAATARETGDEFVVSDSDFQTDVLEDHLSVTNLRN